MGKIRSEDWQFSEGKTATVCWITSPQTNRETGARFCDAYFQQKSGEMPKPVPVPLHAPQLPPRQTIRQKSGTVLLFLCDTPGGRPPCLHERASSGQRSSSGNAAR